MSKENFSQRFPRLVIAGTQSGVGKTTAATGLMAVLAERMAVQPYKVGPDYIDPAYHSRITGRKSRNLDGWMLDRDTLVYLFQRNSRNASISIIEGVMGLFDGAQGSTAQVAKTLLAPVILVIDGRGMAESAAAMVRGYRDFQPDLDLAGVIINNVSGESHYEILKEAIELQTGVKAFGYLPKHPGIELPSRHLGLVPSVEIPELEDKLKRLKDLVAKTMDMEGLLHLANSWEKPLPASSFSIEPLGPPNSIPVAVAWDQAFNFYYWDNLDLLEELGARNEYFSPLADQKLPTGAGALLLGGGFPEIFASDLEANSTIRGRIREALSAGMPYTAECGGLMYLLDRLVDFEGREYQMVGWLQGTCRMTEKLQNFGYAELKLQKSCIYGPAGGVIRVHEFHRSILETPESARAYHLEKKRKGARVREWECGLLKGNGVAGYPHLHYYSNLNFARNFLLAAQEYHQREGGGR